MGHTSLPGKQIRSTANEMLCGRLEAKSADRARETFVVGGTPAKSILTWAVITRKQQTYLPCLQRCTGPIPLTTCQTVQAIASASGYVNSNIATASYSVTVAPTATPTFSLAPGTYSATQTVAIADSTAGATIYYTTDATQPTTSSPVYTSPITISSSEIVLAIATSSSYLNSSMASAV